MISAICILCVHFFRARLSVQILTNQQIMGTFSRNIVSRKQKDLIPHSFAKLQALSWVIFNKQAFG